MIDVGTLVGDIPTTSVTIRTYGTSTVNDYGETTATPTDTVRSMVVHPASTKLLLRLPDSDRARETIAVYDTAAVLTVGSSRPARIQYQSQWYEVIDSENYAELGGIYIALAQLIEGS